MTEFRKWNYKADDYTYDIGSWQVGFYLRGRYRGFDALLAAGLNLQLIQSTSGIEIIDDDQAAPAILGTMGMWVTPQGTVIKEDAPVILPISAGGGLPRIDLIVGQHTYIMTPGGAFALYLVIQGTPDANPTPPALTFPNIQTVLGQLYVPAGMTDLNGVGVVYTPATVPDWAGDSTVAHLERAQTWTAAPQSFYSIENRYATVVTVTANQLVLPDDGSANCYYINLAAPPAVDVRTSITGLSISFGSVASHVRRIEIYSPYALLLSAGFVGVAAYVEVNTWFVLIRKDDGTFTVESGDGARLGRVNKFHFLQIKNTTNIGTTLLDASGRLMLPNNANIIYLKNDATLNQLVAIQTSETHNPTETSGGCIIDLIPNSGNDLLISPLNFSFTPTYRPLRTPNDLPVVHRGPSIIRFIEDGFYWWLQSWEPAWVAFNTAFNSISGGGTVTITSQTMRYMVTANKVEIECSLVVDITGTPSSFRITAPPGYTPRSSSLGVFHFAGVSFTTFEPAIAMMLVGNLISIIKTSGNFAAGVGQGISFRLAYELNT